MKAQEACKELAEAATCDRVLNAFVLRPVLDAQAAALPWRHVRNAIDHGLTPVDALKTIREDVTTHLVERSETSSTDALHNELEHIQREAYRKFLHYTKHLAV